MVADDKEGPKRLPRFSKTGGCVTRRDAKGTCWKIPRDQHSNVLVACPEVEVWWERTHGGHEFLILRQPNDHLPAMVITLTLGQVYAAIDALNKAVEGA